MPEECDSLQYVESSINEGEGIGNPPHEKILSWSSQEMYQNATNNTEKSTLRGHSNIRHE